MFVNAPTTIPPLNLSNSSGASSDGDNTTGGIVFGNNGGGFSASSGGLGLPLLIGGVVIGLAIILKMRK